MCGYTIKKQHAYRYFQKIKIENGTKQIKEIIV